VNRFRAACVLAYITLASACLIQANYGYFTSVLSGDAVGADDAYISFRYARNLVAGHGLVFNPGERVEGYSNLLYVFCILPGMLVLDPDHVYGWAVAINLIFVLGALHVFGRIVSRDFGDRNGVTALWLFALCPVLWMWTSAGLETPLVLLIQMLTWLEVSRTVDSRSIWRLSVLAIAAVLVRPDGVLIAGTAVVVLLLSGQRARAVTLALVTVGAVLSVTLWRLSYYGDWLPNTYYAKATSPVLERVRASLRQFIRIAPMTGLLLYTGAILLWPLAVPRASLARWRCSRAAPFAFLHTLVLLTFWIFVGGDVFDERLLTALFPFGAYAVMAVLETTDPRRISVIAACCLLLQLSALNRQDRRFAFRMDRYDHRLALARVLKRHEPRGVLAIDAAGKVPYWTGLVTIDILGLNDRHIARLPDARPFHVGHTKSDPDYVLSRHPDLIAAWIASPALDLMWGFSRAKYTAAGYRLKYLVNAGESSRGSDVVDAHRLDSAAVRQLILQGYRYGVLARDWAASDHRQRVLNIPVTDVAPAREP
jgi:arabinofuranosyltransferase